MPSRVEDYAIIGDCHTAALVGRDGSIDWLCLPRFDSGACFAALLGGPGNGRWLIRPAVDVREVRRRYREGTLVLETEFVTDHGAVKLIDFMPVRENHPVLVRMIEGTRGRVPMKLELVIRYDYGSIVPWVERRGSRLRAAAGPDTLHIDSDIPLHGENLQTVAQFDIAEGQSEGFVLSWSWAHDTAPKLRNWRQSLADTEKWWRDWSSQCAYSGDWNEAVIRSLITLKALTFMPTGALVAAPTTSLPERIGGVRNWDYRYCWLRDSTFTLRALLAGGFHEEARAWIKWLVRAVAGTPSELQILYGLAGERRLPEMELPWLSGYRESLPVRTGNAAHGQFQLDVYGEILETMLLAQQSGLSATRISWNVELALLGFLEGAWQKPDHGIWEVRGPQRHFTHSKLMAWVAFDRAVRSVEKFGLKGNVERWRSLRDLIHSQICERGFNQHVNSFVQYYNSGNADASLLMLAPAGFLPAHDSRILGTVEFIRRELVHDGVVYRYANQQAVDGLPEGEGAFLACTFWLADNLSLQGRDREAREMFERMLDLRNDVGLLPEEYDPKQQRFLGNFPQAFSHLALVNTAKRISDP